MALHVQNHHHHLRQPNPITLDLFHSLELQNPLPLSPPLPFSSQSHLSLNFKAGEAAKMSRRTPKLDLKLNLSPPRANPLTNSSPGRSASVSPTSPPSSCVSSENGENSLYSTSPEATSSMVLVGCPRCLMYVMLSEDDPKCPKCKSTVLLEFIHDNHTTNNAAANPNAAAGTTKKTRKS